MEQRFKRRAVLALGIAGAAVLSGVFAKRARAQSVRPACVLTPEQTEGPFYVEERLNRSDIRSDPSSGAVKPGTPLHLTFNVSRVAGGACVPLAGAQVHLWHCDAAGAYSDVRDAHASTLGQKFLRGYQITNQHGVATFDTIYPGWYSGRAVHIHFKIRPPGESRRAREFTSQIYFDDNLTDKIYLRAPYASRGPRETRNDDDSLFRRGGRNLVIALREEGAGYSGSFDVGLA